MTANEAAEIVENVMLEQRDIFSHVHSPSDVAQSLVAWLGKDAYSYADIEYLLDQALDGTVDHWQCECCNEWFSLSDQPATTDTFVYGLFDYHLCWNCFKNRLQIEESH